MFKILLRLFKREPNAKKVMMNQIQSMTMMAELNQLSSILEERVVIQSHRDILLERNDNTDEESMDNNSMKLS